MTGHKFASATAALVVSGLFLLYLFRPEIPGAETGKPKVTWKKPAVAVPSTPPSTIGQNPAPQGPTLAASLDESLEGLEMQESLKSAETLTIWIASHGCRGPCSIYQVVLNSEEVEFTGSKYVAERGVMRRRISTEFWQEMEWRARSLQLFKMTQEQIDSSCGRGPLDGRTYSFGMRIGKKTRLVKLGRGCRGGFRDSVRELLLLIAKESGADERFACDRMLNCLPIGHRWGPDR